MRASLRTVVIVALAALQTTTAAAANIMVTSTSDDTVGQSIVYNLRNQVNRSSLHKLVYTREDAGFTPEMISF